MGLLPKGRFIFFSMSSAAISGFITSTQGLTLVHFSAQLESRV
jgi:hypothetical protein